MNEKKTASQITQLDRWTSSEFLIKGSGFHWTNIWITNFKLKTKTKKAAYAR